MVNGKRRNRNKIENQINQPTPKNSTVQPKIKFKPIDEFSYILDQHNTISHFLCSYSKLPITSLMLHFLLTEYQMVSCLTLLLFDSFHFQCALLFVCYLVVMGTYTG